MDAGEDLRAPKFRRGGVAVEEPAAPAEIAVEAPRSAVTVAAGDAKAGHGDEARTTVGAGDEEEAAGPGTIKGEAPPAEGVRSVVVACVIGALIAAFIVVGAFLLRPSQSEVPAGPAAPAAQGAAS